LNTGFRIGRIAKDFGLQGAAPALWAGLAMLDRRNRMDDFRADNCRWVPVRARSVRTVQASRQRTGHDEATGITA
jgi:hypothetical protein